MPGADDLHDTPSPRATPAASPRSEEDDGVPRALLRSLALAPFDRAGGGRVAIVVRHAHRGPLLPGAESDQTVITEVGVRAAERLGGFLDGHRPGRVLASPSLRCVQTARALSRGAHWTDVAPPEPDYRLHGVGALVQDPEVAFPEFRRLGIDGMIERLFAERGHIPGFRTPLAAAEHVLGAALEDGPAKASDGAPRLDVLVSHDVVIARVLGALLDVSFHGERDLPAFLDGIVVWRATPGRIGLAWGGTAHELDWPPSR